MVRGEGMQPNWEAAYDARIREWSNPGLRDNNDAIVVSAGAHEKVDREGRLKSWPGQSIVTFVSQDSEDFRRTSALTSDLRARFAKAGVAHNFGWLPSESWHFTLVDGGNGEDVLQREVVAHSVANSFINLREERLQAPRLALSGPFISGATTILELAKPVDEQSWNTLRHMIDVIRTDLHRSVDPEVAKRIAQRLPDQWMGHKAVAYLTQETMSAEDYTLAKEILSSHHNREPLVVTLDSFELRGIYRHGQLGESTIDGTVAPSSLNEIIF